MNYIYGVDERDRDIDCRICGVKLSKVGEYNNMEEMEWIENIPYCKKCYSRI